jgi:hypothetical protein
MPQVRATGKESSSSSSSSSSRRRRRRRRRRTPGRVTITSVAMLKDVRIQYAKTENERTRVCTVSSLSSHFMHRF